METRQLTQVKIYRLWLSDIRSKNGIVKIRAIAYDKQKLIDWYKAEVTPLYQEYGEKPNDMPQPKQETGLSVVSKKEMELYTKSFKKDGPLEWNTPCNNIEEYDNNLSMGINDAWTTQEQIDKVIKENNGSIIHIDPIQ